MLISDRWNGEKYMACGLHHAFTQYINIYDTNNVVTCNEEGIGKFNVQDGGLAIYIPLSTYQNLH